MTRLIFILLLIPLLHLKVDAQKIEGPNQVIRFGGLERADTTQPRLYLVFTGHDYADGAKFVRRLLRNKQILAHFFFTGDFYRNPRFKKAIKRFFKDGHYLGPHSDKHLLYASWENRDSLLISRPAFRKDVLDNYEALQKYGISIENAPLFMPPYEWYNQQISDWTQELGLQLVNFTPGTRSNADYITPNMDHYQSSEALLQSILRYEEESPNGLNGFLLLIHLGTHPDRTDKLYHRLPELIDILLAKGYQFEQLMRLLSN